MAGWPSRPWHAPPQVGVFLLLRCEHPTWNPLQGGDYTPLGTSWRWWPRSRLSSSSSSPSSAAGLASFTSWLVSNCKCMFQKSTSNILVERFRSNRGRALFSDWLPRLPVRVNAQVHNQGACCSGAHQQVAGCWMFCYKKPPNVIFFPLTLENILEFGKIWDIFSKLSFFQQLLKIQVYNIKQDLSRSFQIWPSYLALEIMISPNHVFY